MFTGIVEEMGIVDRVTRMPGGARLRVRADALPPDLSVGDCIALNGVCLTLVAAGAREFEADLSVETVRRTTLGELQLGDVVNLERPLRLDQRLGGHLVQGHVDGVGTITALRPEGGGAWMEIRPPDGFRRYLAEKGSVTVDGVSLTVAGLPAAGTLEVALVPHTLAVTTLGRRRSGDRVNLEADVLAKYVERRLNEGKER